MIDGEANAGSRYLLTDILRNRVGNNGPHAPFDGFVRCYAHTILMCVCVYDYVCVYVCLYVCVCLCVYGIFGKPFFPVEYYYILNMLPKKKCRVMNQPVLRLDFFFYVSLSLSIVIGATTLTSRRFHMSDGGVTLCGVCVYE